MPRFTSSGGGGGDGGALKTLGNGAISAHEPDSTATGGDARGANAVDLQVQRVDATQVASGESAVITGGHRNTANGIRAAIVAGWAQVASGNYGFLGNGSGNEASGASSGVVAGTANRAAGASSGVVGGAYNHAAGERSFIPGGGYGYARLYGQMAHAAASPFSGISGAGYMQRADYVLSQATTDATATELFLNMTSERLVLDAGRALAFQGSIIAESSAGDTAFWRIEGAIKNRAGTVTTIGTPAVTSVAADTNAGGWGITVAADDVNDALTITATGAAATNIRWVAHVATVEVVY